MEAYGMDDGVAAAVPRRARSQSRVAAGQDGWAAADEAPYGAPYGARGRSPGRSNTGVEHMMPQSHGSNRGSFLEQEPQPHFVDNALYYDGVEPPYAVNGGGGGGGDVRGRGQAPQHDVPSWRGPTLPPQAARSALGPRGALPPGYGMASPPQNGWHDDGAAKQMLGGPPGGWGEAPPDTRAAGLHRRGGYADHEAGNQEQWRQIQSTLHKQDASKAAAEMAALKQTGPRAGALKRGASYAMRRTWYLVDSKIGTLKYQVLMLIGVAVVISVSGGKIVQVVRDMAVEEGLLENYTTYSDGVWLAWSLIIDPGYGTWPDSVVGVRMRAVTVIIVIIGILYLSVIIALIVDAVQVKMEDLKKARVTAMRL
jgi:hypothetical protein